ncbi:autotransporter outer membrane beta-barrel domain-containing protein [Helicobacter sp. 11S02629-2]|uniref:autotransporter family protein n=1 Tax=Helicobacter sp. 11S02629-2 TaxID=1476195 RepID=UPI000BA4EF5F|nr:autotransporter outer membrane beta-barrel domain-containing protein [Helicobacter sp. 11S02629-2]PAF45577.1 hypothetical protein BKH40_01470 [Helicobacter sp. 11S02629-2]
MGILYKSFILASLLFPSLVLADVIDSATVGEARDYTLSNTNSLSIKLKPRTQVENPNNPQPIKLGNITAQSDSVGSITLDSISSDWPSQRITASFKSIGTSDKRVGLLMFKNTFESESNEVFASLYNEKGNIYLNSLTNSNTGKGTTSSGDFHASSPSANNTIVANVLDANTITLSNKDYDEISFQSGATGKINLYVNTLKAKSATFYSVVINRAFSVDPKGKVEGLRSPSQSNTIDIDTLKLANTNIDANSLTSKDLTIDNSSPANYKSNVTNINLTLDSANQGSKFKVTKLTTDKGTSHYGNNIYLNANNIEVESAKINSLSINYTSPGDFPTTATITIKDLDMTNGYIKGNTFSGDTIKLFNGFIDLQGTNSTLSAKSLILDGDGRSNVEADKLEGTPTFVSTGGMPLPYPNSLTIRGNSPTTLASINLGPFTTITTGGDLSINGLATVPTGVDSKTKDKALFNFSTTTKKLGYLDTSPSETTFNLASIESKGTLSLPSLYLNGLGDTNTLKTNLESFLNQASLQQNGTEIKALLLKPDFLKAQNITIGGTKVDASFFSGVFFSVKDIKGSDVGSYRVSKTKVDSNLTFIDFYLGDKQSQSLSPTKLSLLATYNQDALYNLIKGSTLNPSDIPKTSTPSTPSSPSMPSSPSSPSIPGTPSDTSQPSIPGTSDNLGTSDKNTPFNPSPTPETNLEVLAKDIGNYGYRYKPNTPSSKIFNRLNNLQGSSDPQKRQDAIAVLKDLLPSDLNDAIENYALESNSASLRMLDSIVSNSSLANSLRFLTKAYFASNDINDRIKNYDPSSPFISLLGYEILPNDSFDYLDMLDREVYAQVLYQNIFQGERKTIEGYNLNSFGFVGGYNQRLASVLVGVNLTYTTAFTSLDSNYNSLSPRIYFYSLDGSSGLVYQSSLGYSLHSIAQQRSQTSLNTQARSSFFANEFNAYALLGYKFNFLHKHFLTPALRLSYIYLNQNAYTESGEFGLKVPSKSDHALLLSAGVNYEYKVLEGFKIGASGFLFYDVLSKSKIVNVAFLDDGISFSSASLGNDPLGVMLNLSASYDLDASNSLAFTYSGTFKSSLIATTLSLRYGYKF